MSVLVVAFAPLLLSYLMILVMGNWSTLVRWLAPNLAPPPVPKPALAPDQFETILEDLLAAAGLELLLASEDEKGAIRLVCRDPRPLTGRYWLIGATPLARRGRVGPAEVLVFADSVLTQAEGTQGIFIAVAGFTHEARASAASASPPVVLVDGAKLSDLMREHLPECAALLDPWRPSDDGAAPTLVRARSTSGRRSEPASPFSPQE
jgi:hypothetical protein